MKKLTACALALMAVATTAPAATYTLWTSSLFGRGAAEIQSVDFAATRATQPLVTITTDRDASVSNLSAVTNGDNEITGLLAQENDGTAKSFSLAQIESRNGAVLAVVSGRNALVLQGSLNQNTQEGRFRIDYLTNGLFMKYASCDFNLKRDNAGGAYIQNAYTGARVSRVHVISHSLGITTLQGLCPAK